MPEQLIITTLLSEETEQPPVQDLRIVCDATQVETLVTEFKRQYTDIQGVSVYDWGHSARFGHGYIVLTCEEPHLSELLPHVKSDPRILGHLIYDLPEVVTTPVFSVQKKGDVCHAGS